MNDSPDHEPKRPVSERKLAANRENASHSTGPRTPEGKARSSLNGLRHGILARAAFNERLEGEERRAEFDEIVEGLSDEFHPVTLLDRMLIQQLAGCYWRLAKVLTFERESAWRNGNFLNVPNDERIELFETGYYKAIDTLVEDQKKIFREAGLGAPTLPNRACSATIIRYEASINRVLFRLIATLERRKQQRLAIEEADATNPQSQSSPTPATPAPSAAAGGHSDESKAASSPEMQRRTQKSPPDAAPARLQEPPQRGGGDSGPPAAQ